MVLKQLDIHMQKEKNASKQTLHASQKLTQNGSYT